MNESRSLRAFEDVTECDGGKLYARRSVGLHSGLHFNTFVGNTTPIVARPKFHLLASFTGYSCFKNLAGAILHISGKRIDTDSSPALLLKRFCIRHERAVSRSHIQEESILYTRKNFFGHPLVPIHLRIKCDQSQLFFG